MGKVRNANETMQPSAGEGDFGVGDQSARKLGKRRRWSKKALVPRES